MQVLKHTNRASSEAYPREASCLLEQPHKKKVLAAGKSLFPLSESHFFHCGTIFRKNPSLSHPTKRHTFLPVDLRKAGTKKFLASFYIPFEKVPLCSRKGKKWNPVSQCLSRGLVDNCAFFQCFKCYFWSIYSFHLEC